ncbi:M13 family metallopeptidase [Rivibacter subsaxonicus]|uniref:Endothelin-converting enzyme n=1 Tax=Rivibacter subsaxonicus TaxID=457575 RepID=A0A4Q7V7R4_9BURK|nr:M13 family metallopeptidase [Rivibacter subsaxonicus]RZT91894.1 endothelin-converting enzyme [Rivibacter subsaxonicus]
MPLFSPRRLAPLLALLLLAGAAPARQPQPLSTLPYAPSLDPSSLDREVDACVDFHRFSCGGWMKNNPIPPDEAGWSVYAKLQDENLRYLWGLLIAAAEPGSARAAHEQKAGDYFAACVAAETAADADTGLAALAGPLAAIEQLDSRAALAPLLAGLHRLGAGHSLFRFGAEQDAADSSQVIAVADAAGLGLPDRDHYFKRDKASLALKRAYQAHVARSFELAGATPVQARSAAREVLGIETALAAASLTSEQKRDPRGVYHRMTLAELQGLAPGFDWRAYLEASGVAADTALNVTQPRFMRALGGLLAGRPLAEWKSYLRWHLLRSQSPYLSPAFAQAHFDFYGKTLEGIESMPPRWKQCVQWVDRDLGEALGQMFVEKTFAPATRDAAVAMTRHIEDAMRARIEALDWMSEPTKAAALAKLQAISDKVGYPERWRDYGGLAIAREGFVGNVQRSLGFERARQLAKIGRPLDRGEWFMTPPTVNAYYDPQMNSINFPAGILQPPLFDPRMDDAPNYGNTGATIGHELTHAFDDEGRQFDAQGNLRDWWTKQDAAAFKQRAQCVVDQYSHYTVVDEIRINGRLTLGEDVADLGGTILAYAAWKAATAGQDLQARDGFTPEQRFFIGMAQWACGNERPERLRLQALNDPHSPARHRVNGVLANMPEFAQAFACKPDQPMVRAKPCRVW